MRFQGFLIPEGMISDMNYIKSVSGTSKSQIVRQALTLFFNDFFQKEKVKQEQIQENNRRRATIQSGGGITLPDGW